MNMISYACPNVIAVQLIFLMGSLLIKRRCLKAARISIIDITRSGDSLMFIMGISIRIRLCLLDE